MKIIYMNEFLKNNFETEEQKMCLFIFSRGEV